MDLSHCYSYALSTYAWAAAWHRIASFAPDCRVPVARGEEFRKYASRISSTLRTEPFSQHDSLGSAGKIAQQMAVDYCRSLGCERPDEFRKRLAGWLEQSLQISSRVGKHLTISPPRDPLFVMKPAEMVQFSLRRDGQLVQQIAIDASEMFRPPLAERLRPLTNLNWSTAGWLTALAEWGMHAVDPADPTLRTATLLLEFSLADRERNRIEVTYVPWPSVCRGLTLLTVQPKAFRISPEGPLDS